MNTSIANRQLSVPTSAVQARGRGLHRAVLATLAMATLAMLGAMAGFATDAQANSFTDGGFGGFTGSSAACSSNSGTNTQQVTNSDLPGWTVNAGYAFVLNTGNYQNFSSTFGGNGGSCVGLQPTVTSPPIGSVFLGIDPSYLNNTSGTGWSIAQIVTGLIPGATYALTFNMGAGQQNGFSGATTDTWMVGLSTGTGGCPTSTVATCEPNTGTTTSGSSQTLDLPSGGFSGWASAEVNLIATAANEVLWFFAEANTVNGQPPFLLLDGVSMTVPEPPAYGVLIVGLLGLLGARRFYRKKA